MIRQKQWPDNTVVQQDVHLTTPGYSNDLKIVSQAEMNGLLENKTLDYHV